MSVGSQPLKMSSLEWLPVIFHASAHNEVACHVACLRVFKNQIIWARLLSIVINVLVGEGLRSLGRHTSGASGLHLK